MNFLEIPAALRRATKYDLFTGDLDNLRSVHFIKENVFIFYRSKLDDTIQGPYSLQTNQCFVELYTQMLTGMIGVLTTPSDNTKNFHFHLVLRKAILDDFKELGDVKKNVLYYIYDKGFLKGPKITDYSTLLEDIERLISEELLYIPNKRQHFKNKTNKL